MEGFRQAMSKLAILGQDKSSLVDCSDAVPEPKSLPPLRQTGVLSGGGENSGGNNESANGEQGSLGCVSAAYPPGQYFGDVQQSCPTPFPVLPVTGEDSPLSFHHTGHCILSTSSD